MNLIKIYNYKIYLSDSCYEYLNYNKKNFFGYKIYIKNKGKYFAKTFLYYSLIKKNIFNKIIKIKNIFLIFDIVNICFLSNTCIHFNGKIIINSPNSSKKMFYENKILNKIIFLINFIINKKLLIHNGYIKLNNFSFKDKNLSLTFLGNCSNCNISYITFNKFIIKIFKKIKFIKKIKLNE